MEPDGHAGGIIPYNSHSLGIAGGVRLDMTDLDRFFNPRAIAVVGASRAPEKIGHSIVRNLVDSGYKGTIYPINPKEDEILGHRCYEAVSGTPGHIDLAVIAVPAPLVHRVAEDCGKAGVDHLVTITAGFKEVGKEGLKREQELLEICHKHGMRMLGPNCVGMIDTVTPLNVSFATGHPARGDITLISQSGAMCVAILDWAADREIGFSRFISLGNKADLNEADFISSCAADPNTRVIVCYLEDVTNGSQFLEACRRASRKTPVLILKSGTSEAGARAASSHTGALAGSEAAFDAALRQCGILRARKMDELFELAVAFSNLPIPAGDRVAIVTNSGGPGIICADNVEARGLQMARLSKKTLEALRGKLPAEANIYNPVDMVGSATDETYRYTLDTVLQDPGVDSAVVLLTPTAMIDTEKVAAAIVDNRAKHEEKPLTVALMGGVSVKEGEERLFEAHVPVYTFPEPAVSAIDGLTQFRRLREAVRHEAELAVEVDAEALKRARDVFDAVRAERRVVLLGHEAAAAASAYGITVAPLELAQTPEEAVDIADRLGYPVALKVSSPDIMHKTDIGGVHLGLENKDAVEKAFFQIYYNCHRYMPQAHIHGMEVQKMMPKGVELIVGMARDVQFGPLLAFGLGGIYVNLLKDAAFRLAYMLSVEEIREMVEKTKAYVLLRGFRGDKPKDIDAVVDTVARVARLVTDFEEIAEMDINPLFAYERGVAALDVKITIS